MSLRLNPVPGMRLARWRSEHWPPKGFKAHDMLPIYTGSHDQVREFGETMADALLLAADHIFDKCRTRTPRWMHLPKLHFDVTALTLTQTAAKSSRRIKSLAALESSCGAFPPEARAAVEQWLVQAPGAYVVAHLPFVDMRAYVSKRGTVRPVRSRFYASGLVLAVDDAFVFNDRRALSREERSDAYRNPIAVNDAGWRIFGKCSGAPPAADGAAAEDPS